MSAIERIGQISQTGAIGAPVDSRAAAVDLIARVAVRVDGVARQVSASRPSALDVGRLGPGGDIYGLRALAGDMARATGASVTDEGRLLRALSDLARGAAVRLYGLAGAAEAVRFADLQAAASAARVEPAGRSPAEDLIARIEAAARRLDAAG